LINQSNDEFNEDNVFRLNSVSGAWCPDTDSVSSKNQTSYLQIELHEVYVISAISLQGRFANGNGAEFAREFSVEYYRYAQIT